MSEWTKGWMKWEHQIISLTWQENVLFNRFPVEIITAFLVFISTFTSWEKWSLKSRGCRITALSNRVFALMCLSQKPCESQGRAVLSNVRATVWCHRWPVIMYILGRDTLIWTLRWGVSVLYETDWVKWEGEKMVVLITLNHAQETCCFQKMFILFINFS